MAPLNRRARGGGGGGRAGEGGLMAGPTVLEFYNLGKRSFVP